LPPPAVEMSASVQHEEQPRAVEVPREEISDVPQYATPLVGSAPRHEPAVESPPAAVEAAPLKLEWPADLVQIETDPQKARDAATYVEPEPDPRPRRIRVAPVSETDEPLVQVETRRREIPVDPYAASAREPANTVGHV
jgi:hypothetical protein